MGRSLNYQSSIVEQHENIENDLSPILTVKPERGTVISLLNEVAMGSASGLPIYAELYDQDGDALPVDTDIVLTAKRPGDARFQTVSVKEDNISTYTNKSVGEQQDSNHVDSVKHELKGERINVRDVDELAVEIDSDEVIDWDESKLYFERDGIEERRR